jgi:uncharacterized protein
MTSPRYLHDLRLPLGHQPSDLAALIARRAGRPESSVTAEHFRIVRQSVDARHKTAIIIQYSVLLDPQPERLDGVAALLPARVSTGRRDRPFVVGAGPAGLFAALYLAQAGCRPILIEQGRPVEERQLDVARYWRTGQVDPRSNVQFGEGGAGTFSDGKLTTGIKDPRCSAILEEMVLAGAPPEILYMAKPHVGTEHLRTLVRNLRQKIISLGGEVRFGCRLAGLQQDIAAGRLTGLIVEQQNGEGWTTAEEWPASQVILAIGHSSRATFRWLADLHLSMQPKPFSIGVRIEHPQDLVDHIQYGHFAGHPQLPPADYKLACHLPGGRSVYTFCMCPGGQVVAAASQPESIVTNGMSLHTRSQPNANSALLVGVTPADYPEPGPLGGVIWQEQLERQAFLGGGGQGRAPAERLASFLGLRTDNGASRPAHAGWPDVQPTYLPGVTWCDLGGCLPAPIRAALREAIPVLDRRMPGFAFPAAVLTGVETRSSSPLRILRDESFQSSLTGLYPCGEGAGYAGGIMSAAADGLRAAAAALDAR